jgi:hypothetical protein
MKYRNELKYLCSENELLIIENRINQLCTHDSYADNDGKYIVRSIYFDDYQNSCCQENEAGLNNREKYRIRIYNGSLSKIFFECKKKENSMNYKISFEISENLCKKMIEGEFFLSDIDEKLFTIDEMNLLRKFVLKCMTNNFSPAVIVEYERTPYSYEIGNVRITFDRNITSCSNINTFMDSRIVGRPVMPIGKHILEVKFDEMLPDYFYNIMQISGLHRTAYSKYLICRKYGI